MKLFSVVLFVISSQAMAKNKVLYTVALPQATQQSPLIYELFVMQDFKSSGSRLIDKGIFRYASSSDAIIYIREADKEHKLFIITNFTTMNKIEIASKASSFKLQDNSLFYTQWEQEGDKMIKNLYVITDFKTLVKYKLQTNISDFEVDLN